MHGQTALDGYEPIAPTKRSEQSERIDIAPSGLGLAEMVGFEPTERFTVQTISSFPAVCYIHGFSCQFQPALYARNPA